LDIQSSKKGLKARVSLQYRLHSIYKRSAVMEIRRNHKRTVNATQRRSAEKLLETTHDVCSRIFRQISGIFDENLEV
jgi:hypothetical protein